jgi:DNA adenine methylase
MAGVVIECLGWAEFIERPDRKDMLFYLDPPNWNGESDYGNGVFSRADFTALADRLRRLKGRFILSINDLPDVREVFSGFKLAPVSLTYTVTGGEGTPAKELIITG